MSVGLLYERIGNVDGVLHDTLSRWCDDLEPLAIAIAAREPSVLWITGAGGSEGPARTLAALTQSADLPARFVPLSLFAMERDPACFDPTKKHRGTLVVVSQGISPNAQLALGSRERFGHCVLVTSVEARPSAAEGSAERLVSALEREGSTLLLHPPADERGLLVRIMGPAAATLVVMMLASRLSAHGAAARISSAMIGQALASLPEARARARELSLPADFDSLAIVTAGAGGDLAHGHRWKLLESVAWGDPPVWDVLQVAHGPFQQYFTRSTLLIGMETPSSGHLFDRLERILVAGRHHLVRLRSRTELPVAWLEHDAGLNELVLSLFARRPRNLVDWPGKGEDEAIYRFGASQQR